MQTTVSNAKLEELIRDFEIIDEEVLVSARTQADASQMPLGQYLVEHDHIKDAELGQIIADYFKVGFVDLEHTAPEPALAKRIPESVARAKHTLVYKRDKDAAYVATADPANRMFLKSLEQKVGLPLRVAYATPVGIEKALRVYRSDGGNGMQACILSLEKNPDNQEAVVHLVDALVDYAHESGASDIHLEPGEQQLTFRLRIDGVMHTAPTIPKKLSELIVMRIKIMSKLRTDEHRAPQDGKFRFATANEGAIDVRVSIVPVTGGENVVMRLLATHGRRFLLGDLGFSQKDLKKIHTFIKSPHGMILTTGPTGSGKTTTLYTMLQILHRPEVTIKTIEDPVEYDMEGISQIQVNPKANLTFAQGLRSIVRQDPDIIMVGEVRDQETASIAVNSAMTGHLVLSTLHANNAPTAIPRLLDMDIEPFLVGSTVNVLIAQRLVRKICERCRVSYTPDAKEQHVIQSDAEIRAFFNVKDSKKDADALRLYKGTGCPSCNGSGYRGRIGIFEVMEMTEAVKSLVLARASSDDIMKCARKEGMTTMLEDGLQKARDAMTTLEEVIRVTKL